MIAGLNAKLLILVTLILSGACSEANEAQCQDFRCPEGQICAPNGLCETLSSPSKIGDLGRYTQLRIRENGSRVTLSYDATYQSLVLIEEEGRNGPTSVQIIDGWRVEDEELVDVNAGQFASMSLNGSTLHISWYDLDQGALRYVRMPPNGLWQSETIDGKDGSDRGRHSHLALSSQGLPHIAYYDETRRRLRHATQTTAGDWNFTEIDHCLNGLTCPEAHELGYGQHNAITVFGDRPRIAYYDSDGGDLILAEHEHGTHWVYTRLDGRDPESDQDTGDSGRFVTMALDAKQRVGIAWFDASRGALKYLPPQHGPSPEFIIVDDGSYVDSLSGGRRHHIVGQHVALTFDQAGVANLVYLDASRLVMKIARVAGESVLSVNDLSDLGAGGHVALALDDNGVVRGAYGEWLHNAAPRTRLRWFDLPGQFP